MAMDSNIYNEIEHLHEYIYTLLVNGDVIYIVTDYLPARLLAR